MATRGRSDPSIVVIDDAEPLGRLHQTRHTAVEGIVGVYKWYLPTLSELLVMDDRSPRPTHSPAQQQLRAEREWSGAIAALNVLLQQTLECEENTIDDPCVEIGGVVLSGPVPVLTNGDLLTHFSTWTWTTAPSGRITSLPMPLLPAAGHYLYGEHQSPLTLSLLPADPLGAEQFCLALTPEFSLVMVLGESNEGSPAFLFSFDPAVVQQSWKALRSRVILTNPHVLTKLDTFVASFAPVVPDYPIVTRFTRLMLSHLPDFQESENHRPSDAVVRRERIATVNPFKSYPTFSLLKSVWSGVSKPSPHLQSFMANGKGHRRASFVATVDPTPGDRPEADRPEAEHQGAERQGSDTELLQAIAHEVRTPLTTIRTLTRLLLKRKDLNPDVLKRLEVIDQECTEQIDRFNLIFKAVEVETDPNRRSISQPAPISLAQVFQQTVPRWQQQAKQRDLELDVVLPQKLPLVLADPTMLEQVLTGLIDRITHSLPPRSRIQVQVKLAGHQLKLQFQSTLPVDAGAKGWERGGFVPTLKSLGQLLMFQPETGSLSLNLAVTKNLFQALGGKMIVRQRPEQGEELTIFLPLETRLKEEGEA